MEGLAEEALDLAGAAHGALVLFAQLINAEDGDDVLEILVALQDALHAQGDGVVTLADDLRIKDSRVGGEGIHGGIDALLGDAAREGDEGVQVGEGRAGGRVRQIVGGHIDGLHRRDGTLRGRGDAFLERTHLGRERGLISHGAGHAAQKCRHLRTSLRESEDVVHEHQRLFARRIAELLGHRQGREGHAKTRTRGLVHLTEDHRHLVEHVGLLARGVGVLGLLHFTPEIVALTCALAHASKHGVTTEVLGDSRDHLLDHDGLAHACTTEETDLATSDEGAEEVNHLDTRDEDLGVGVQRGELGRSLVDGAALGRVHGASLVDRLAKQVEDAAENTLADGHRDRCASVDTGHAAGQTVGGTERHGADAAAAEMALNLTHELE